MGPAYRRLSPRRPRLVARRWRICHEARRFQRLVALQPCRPQLGRLELDDVEPRGRYGHHRVPGRSGEGCFHSTTFCESCSPVCLGDLHLPRRRHHPLVVRGSQLNPRLQRGPTIRIFIHQLHLPSARSVLIPRLPGLGASIPQPPHHLATQSFRRVNVSYSFWSDFNLCRVFYRVLNRNGCSSYIYRVMFIWIASPLAACPLWRSTV